MTGRHAGPPHGSAARDATASPYTGKRRYVDDGQLGINLPPDQQRWNGTGFGLPERWETQDCPDDAPDGRCWDCRASKYEPHRPGCPRVPDDPPRCESCGHRDGCECTCCGSLDD